jgi:methyl-accepting chemotaxis protein
MRWNSLATRLVVAFTAFVLAGTAVITIYSYAAAKTALESSLRSHGRMLLSAIESHVGEYLVRYDYVYLRDYVSDIARKEPLVVYAAVVSEDGTLIAHTDHAREGQKWTSGEGSSPTEEVKTAPQGSPLNGGRVLELTAPVMMVGKKWGSVRIGISFAGVDGALRKLAGGIGLAGALALCAAVVGVRVFTSKVTSGFTSLVETTRQISEGELRTNVPEEGFDEIRDLAHSFNTMAENLRSILRQIQATSATVGQFSSTILDTIQEHATGAAQQAASVSEVTATMEELSRTSHQIADNAEAVKNSAAETVEMAQQGTVLVQECVGAMGQIKERVGDIAKRNLFLGEKSHEIGKVMEIIKEIASEIHLLALNAAIESAAAGEHGRRFSVVASEVRRLAEKTRDSTETIRSLITEIQSATSSSIQATEQGTREVDRWRETINLSADAFGEIIQKIEKTLEASTQISLATHQQTNANEQVVHAMRQIAEMVRASATSVRGSSSSAAELKDTAAKLNEITLVFMV